MTERYEDLRHRLEAVSEALTDRAIDHLRSALEAGGGAWPDEEKQLTRARRSVDKAIQILAVLDERGDPPAPED